MPLTVTLRVGVIFILGVITGSLSPARGAKWYVDQTAGGNRTGADWANAWPDLGAISWKEIQPGDTLFISRGKFHEILDVRKSGLSNAPIKIRIAQDSGHNGKVTVNAIDLGAHRWIQVNGALSDSFMAPTNLLTLRQITNNIGLICNNTNGPGIYMTSPTGISVEWIAIDQARRGPTVKTAHGIWANITRRGPTDQNLFRFCLIQNTDDDGIQWIGNDPATHFGHQEIAFCIIQNVGDDGLEANHGFTIHDCILGPSLFINGHPDGVQSLGSFWKIYNNEFNDFFNSWVRIQASQTNHHDIWVYNNLFLSGRYGDPKVSAYNTGIEVVQYAAWLGELDSMTWERIFICNNTFYGGKRLAGGAINWAKRAEETKDAFVHNVVVTNSMFVNNVVVNCARGTVAGWQSIKRAAPWGHGVNYYQEGLRWDYNVVAGMDAPDARRIVYYGTVHPNGETMAAKSLWKNNSSRNVRFVDFKIWNFELDPTDTSARDQGDDLSIYFNYDILNRPRNGRWDRGAYESP